jgi:hypothetical protein
MLSRELNTRGIVIMDTHTTMHKRRSRVMARNEKVRRNLEDQIDQYGTNDWYIVCSKDLHEDFEMIKFTCIAEPVWGKVVNRLIYK